MKEQKINHLAVILSAVLMFPLGGAWYGPIFGESWMKGVGLTMEIIEANPPTMGVWITQLVASLVAGYTLAWLFNQLGVDSIGKGIGISLLMTTAFFLFRQMGNNMFAQVPYYVSWINGGYALVGGAIMGAIIGGWTKK